ncbi:MAG: hypothetical protein K0S80_4093 [Neobacillus sp.]|nr:hypothetical protein [Neobacillus sp.]
MNKLIIRQAELSVEQTNKKAWTFWEKQGFTVDEEFRYYFYKL